MTALRCCAVLLLLIAVAEPTVWAHEVRPGYLELRALDRHGYDVLWKVPARGDRRLGLYVRLPEHCSESQAVSRFFGGAYIERWRASCAKTLDGETITIQGLPATRTDVLARVERLDGGVQTVRLIPDSPSFTVSATPGSFEIAKTYFVLGVEHILLGIDHLLFVLALLFLVGSWSRLIATVTAFTVAHSLTLAAATLGWVYVPQAPVEAAIALSIVLIATEILHARQGQPGLTARQPWILAFVFGLLHGLGFAGALQEVGLPEHAIPLALALFNIGVEAGQLLFIAAVFVLFWLLQFARDRSFTRAVTGAWHVADSIATPTAYGIGTLAAFWLFERTYSFWV